MLKDGFPPPPPTLLSVTECAISPASHLQLLLYLQPDSIGRLHRHPSGSAGHDGRGEPSHNGRVPCSAAGYADHQLLLRPPPRLLLGAMLQGVRGECVLYKRCKRGSLPYAFHGCPVLASSPCCGSMLLHYICA